MGGIATPTPLKGERLRLLRIVCGARWSCGRVSGFQSKEPGFEITSTIWKLGQFHSPHYACHSEETVKAVGPFYLVSMPGEVKDPTQGNGKKTVMDSLTLEKDTLKKPAQHNLQADSA